MHHRQLRPAARLAFTSNWTSTAASASAFYGRRVLLVRYQHANPLFDDSYGVNSASLGAYGDALTYELLPEIERRYRAIGQPWARAMYGGSTGGWVALAQQVFYPHVFGLCIANAPDPVDFHSVATLDLYHSTNAYHSGHAGRSGPFKRTPRTDMRDYLGRSLSTSDDVNALEHACGSRGRSGGQYDIWQAIFSPLAEDGYPVAIWDKGTGEINASVADAWRAYDLVHVLTTRWATLGPLLAGKIRVNVGASDAFFLNTAVYRLENAMERLERPAARAVFKYGTSRGRGFSHAWSGDNSSSMRVNDLTLHQRLVAEAVDHMLATAPSGADVHSWRDVNLH